MHVGHDHVNVEPRLFVDTISSIGRLQELQLYALIMWILQLLRTTRNCQQQSMRHFMHLATPRLGWPISGTTPLDSRGPAGKPQLHFLQEVNQITTSGTTWEHKNTNPQKTP